MVRLYILNNLKYQDSYVDPELDDDDAMSLEDDDHLENKSSIGKQNNLHKYVMNSAHSVASKSTNYSKGE